MALLVRSSEILRKCNVLVSKVRLSSVKEDRNTPKTDYGSVKPYDNPNQIVLL